MSMLQCRGSIALAAVMVVLISSNNADAQVVVQLPPQVNRGLTSDLITGVEYDRVNQALAIHRLQSLQSKIQRDAERCNSAAVDRDARRINSLRYRISIDEWLIRKNSLQEPCFYPGPIPTDPMSCAAIAAASRPAPSPYHQGP